MRCKFFSSTRLTEQNKEMNMPIIKPLSLESANPDQKKVLEGIKAKMGKVPNIYATVAHSPAAITALLENGSNLKKGVLTPKEIEAIALAVGQANGCDYCVAAHTVIGKMEGLTAEETLEFRKGKAKDARLNALLRLSIEIVETCGRPSPAAIEAFRKAGYSDAALVEVIAWVAHNIFTNYFNHIVETESDFPAAPALSTGRGSCGCCSC
jgi:uncharacterized peroxidase-related enzyme